MVEEVDEVVEVRVKVVVVVLAVVVPVVVAGVVVVVEVVVVVVVVGLVVVVVVGVVVASFIVDAVEVVSSVNDCVVLAMLRSAMLKIFIFYMIFLLYYLLADYSNVFIYF